MKRSAHPRRTQLLRTTAAAGVIVATAAAVSGPGSRAHAAGSTKSPRPAFGTIWALNDGTDPVSITEYAPAAKGNTAPIATIAGSKTGLTEPDGIAVTTTGAIWVTNPSASSLTEYAPGAHGNVAPIATITGANTELDIPTAIALAKDGSIWVIDDGSTPSTLLHFAAKADGNVAPLSDITGSKTGLVHDRGIALTPDDKHLWVGIAGGGSGPSSVIEFATKSHGNVAPVSTIEGANTQLGGYPYGVAVNAADEVIIGSDDGPNALLTYAAGAHGNVAPIREVTGSSSLVTEPSFLTLDALGNVWFENYEDSNVLEESPTATGNIAPKRLIAGAKTHLSLPNAVAVYSAVPSAPLNLAVHVKSHGRVVLGWHQPHSDGGGILAYTAYVRKKAHGSWLPVGAAKGTSLTLKHFSVKKHYQFAVTALNNDGESPRSAPAGAP